MSDRCSVTIGHSRPTGKSWGANRSKYAIGEKLADRKTSNICRQLRKCVDAGGGSPGDLGAGVLTELVSRLSVAGHSVLVAKSLRPESPIKLENETGVEAVTAREAAVSLLQFG